MPASIEDNILDDLSQPSAKRVALSNDRSPKIKKAGENLCRQQSISQQKKKNTVNYDFVLLKFHVAIFDKKTQWTIKNITQCCHQSTCKAGMQSLIFRKLQIIYLNA